MDCDEASTFLGMVIAAGTAPFDQVRDAVDRASADDAIHAWTLADAFISYRCGPDGPWVAGHLKATAFAIACRHRAPRLASAYLAIWRSIDPSFPP
jgi:hypothetical protein